jgi:hypothetical protein
VKVHCVSLRVFGGAAVAALGTSLLCGNARNGPLLSWRNNTNRASIAERHSINGPLVTQEQHQWAIDDATGMADR